MASMGKRNWWPWRRNLAANVPQEMVSNNVSGGRIGISIQARDITGSISVIPAEESLPEHLSDPDRWPLIETWDAMASGVHSMPSVSAGNDVTSYVQRDIDKELKRQVLHISRCGGVILIVGDSTAGKTRSAHQALQETLPNWKVIVPRCGADLARLVPIIVGCGKFPVIWLDEFQRYLGLNALEPGLLSEFMRLNVPIVATMRTSEYESLAPGIQRAGQQGLESSLNLDIGAQVLKSCRLIELSRTWSENELARARECDDERVVEAEQRHGEFGIAEYLAAGPLLWREWLHAWRASGDPINGHPRGAALVAAAFNLARAGLKRIPETLLVRVHEYYLNDAGGAALRPEPLSEAIAWCTKIRVGIASFLIPENDMTWKPFEYLLDRYQQEGCPAIPDFMWNFALDEADVEERYRIGINAYPSRPDIAEVAWRPLAEAGFSSAAFSLGVLMYEGGRQKESEEMFHRAASNGHSLAMLNLGHMIWAKGAENEGESWLRRAIADGATEAMVCLGSLLRERGETAESEALYRQALNLGQPLAWNNLGNVLSETGRLHDAKEAYCRGIDEGDGEAAFNYGKLCVRLGEVAEAEQMLRLAIELGHHLAAITLSRHLIDQGNFVVAEQVLRDSVEEGYVEAANELGALYGRQGRDKDARRLFHIAEEGGIQKAAFNLGLSFHRDGLIDEAEEAYRRGARSGDANSLFNLSLLLHESGRTAEAKDTLRQAGEAGQPAAMYNLASILLENGSVVEAKSMYKKASDSGSAEAANRLGVILMAEGQSDAAEGELRRAIELGCPFAVANLGGLLRKEGRLKEAKRLYRTAFDAGNLSVCYNFGNLLMDEGMHAEAEEVYKSALTIGGEVAVDAAYALASLFAESGRFGEASAMFEAADGFGQEFSDESSG